MQFIIFSPKIVGADFNVTGVIFVTVFAFEEESDVSGFTVNGVQPVLILNTFGSSVEVIWSTVYVEVVFFVVKEE